MNYFDEEELLFIHHQFVERYGGSHGLRDIERIKSVTAAPQLSVFGVDQYESVFEKAAVYARNIIGDHPFTDGNKRTGITSAVLFLDKNGKKFEAQKGELEDFAVQIATEHLDIPAIAAWLEKHTK